MRDQQGLTLIEMVVTLAILALVSGMAALAGVGIIGSARIAAAANQLVDNLSYAREYAIARYAQQRIRFLPAPGSEVVFSYVLEACAVSDPFSAACLDESEWVIQEHFAADPGSGLKVPLTGGSPVILHFDRNGRLLNTSDVEIQVCRVVTGSGGIASCKEGAHQRSIRIRKFSGIVES